MKKSKILNYVIIGLLSVVLIITSVPLVNASDLNSTPVSDPFITIDPIGNHTIGEVFFINGTTNLPITEKLSLYAYPSWDVRGVKRLKDPGIVVGGIQVHSESNKVNYWSVNVTDGYWLPSDFIVIVHSTSLETNIKTRQIFSLYAPNDNLTLNETIRQPSSLITNPSGTGIGIKSSPTTVITPLPMIITVIGIIVGIVFLNFLNDKKRRR